MCADFVAALPITGAAVSAFGSSLPETFVCASDRLAAHLDELQFDLAEGPRWEAVRTRRPVLVPFLRSDPHTNWPVCGKALLLLDLQAIFVFPLIIGAIDVGVVELYSTAPDRLEYDDVQIAMALADKAAWALLHNVLTWSERPDKVTQVASPLSRREIHQATGMVLAQLESTATEALLRLRAHAFLNGQSVRDVAREVVARTLVFTPD
ncbi:GAF and ANTAR domain-containing protein [Cryobacterium psychrophilum]|nr:GAF and ANTAR domain-containing protein [Cryobacterium psychrophilum]TDW29313.1 ANTAR domain-containing protein [Cryobacterium psychrophilum]